MSEKSHVLSFTLHFGEVHSHREKVLLLSNVAVDAPLFSAGCQDVDALRLC